MSTNFKNPSGILFGVDDPTRLKRFAGAVRPDVVPDEKDDSIMRVVETMKKVDTTSPDAKNNAIQMKTPAGKIIEFNDKETKENTLKGVDK